MGDYYTRVKIPNDSNYVAVAAYNVNPQVEGPSSGEGSGYQEGNARINWIATTGITGQGWYTDDVNSPFAGFTDDQIAQVEIDGAAGNLDKYFSAWGNKSDIDRGEFVEKLLSIDGQKNIDCCELHL